MGPKLRLNDPLSSRLLPGLSRLMLILSQNTHFSREILVFSFFIVLNAEPCYIEGIFPVIIIRVDVLISP